MNKLMISIFIISFWILLPVPMQFMDLGTYSSFEDNIVNPDTPTAITYLQIAFSIVVTYFQLLVLGIPKAPIFVNIILFIMKMISGLVVYLLIRGD